LAETSKASKQWTPRWFYRQRSSWSLEGKF